MQFSDNEVMDAICNNDVPVLQEIIKSYPIDYRLSKESNDTLLSYAISYKFSEAYKFFLDQKDSHNDIRNDEGESILHSAIYSGEISRVMQVVNRENIQSKANDGTSPLLLAIALQYEKITHYLIQQGANISTPDTEENYPIHIASFYGLHSVVEKLISMGVSIKIKTQKGNYPLSLAINNDHEDVAMLLFSKMYEGSSHL